MSCGEMGCQLFGAYRCAISVKDAVLLIHSTVGCNWGPLAFHIPSRVQDFRQASTVMYENDIIHGGEAVLLEALGHMQREFPSGVIFVLTGCVPELIGDDPGKTIAGYSTGREILLLTAPGFKGNAYEGSICAMKALVRHMDIKKPKKNTVNLIGFFADDDRMDSDLKQIVSLLPAPLSVNAVFPYDIWENIRSLSCGELNVVLEGFEAVGELLKESFGIPYIILRYPYGLEGSRNMIAAVSKSIDIAPDFSRFKEQERMLYEQLELAYSSIRRLKGITAAVLGPVWRTGGFIDMLEQELQMRVVYQTDTSCEDTDKEALLKSGAAILFGNSFDRETARQMNISFLPVTYPVFDKINISGRSYCGIFGMLNLVEDIINAVLFPS